MLKVLLRVPVTLIFLLILARCIDPYAPHLDNYQKLLVVEGLITDEKIPYSVRLTRTFQSADSVPETVSDALVYITDGQGNMSSMSYAGNGIYKTDSSQFRGVTDATYILHIKTSDGNEYESEPCVMEPVTGIDSIYYGKAEVIDNINNKTYSGLRIYLDTKEEPGGNQHFRWEYEETWKFKIPYPARYNYVSQSLIIKLDNVNEYCWKENRSNEIIAGSVVPGQSNSIKKQPVLFIPSSVSDRLTVEYSLLVKQYSVTEKEFAFWKDLEDVNSSGGNIFDKQPYSVISNIYCVNKPYEKVLGYFRVSAVKTKRIFIIPDYLLDLNLPGFIYNCPRWVVNPATYMCPGCFGTPPTFDEIYGMFMYNGGFTFVEPIRDDTTKALQYLVFVSKECANCGLDNITSRPDFWIDLP